MSEPMEEFVPISDEALSQVSWEYLVRYIRSLEARNEAMAAVVAAARCLITPQVPYTAGSLTKALEAVDALDAQAGEVTG